MGHSAVFDSFPQPSAAAGVTSVMEAVATLERDIQLMLLAGMGTRPVSTFCWPGIAPR